MTVGYMRTIFHTSGGLRLQYKGNAHLLGRRWWLMKHGEYVLTLFETDIVKEAK